MAESFATMKSDAKQTKKTKHYHQGNRLFFLWTGFDFKGNFDNWLIFLLQKLDLEPKIWIGTYVKTKKTDRRAV